MGTNKSAGTVHTPKGPVQGNSLIDSKSGTPVSVIEDPSGNKRLAVDATITAQEIQVRVELDFNEDSVQIGDPNTGNTLRIESDGSTNVNCEIDASDGDNIGLQVQERNLSPSDLQYNKRVTAKTGTGDNADTTSLDVSLHDHEGNEFSTANTLPVRVSDGVEELEINSDKEALVHDQDTHDILNSILQEIDSGQYAINESFSKASAIAGQLDDVSPTSATENNIAPVRITPQRAIHSNLRDASGNEITNTASGNKKRLDIHSDGVYDASNNTDPSNTGIVLQTRNSTPADSRQVQQITAIRGTTDSTVVSQDVSLHDHNGNQFSSLNPLQVRNNPSPLVDVIYKTNKMLNGSSQAMNVDGSVTPQNFSFTSGIGETWYLEELHLLMSDSGSNNIDEFGNLAGILGGSGSLTNGLLLQIQSKGVAQDYTNLIDNGDIATAFDIIWSPPNGSAFLNDVNSVICVLKFQVPIKIQNSTSDYVRWVVRDNISGIDFLRSQIKLRREN